jgi:sec-independent protein translocase protein TatB
VFNLSGTEIVFILLAALVLLGPEKLPEAMRKVGRVYAEVKKISNGFQAEIRSVIDEPTRDIRNAFEDPARELRNTAEQARAAFNLNTSDAKTTSAPPAAQPAGEAAAAAAETAVPDPPDEPAANPAAASDADGTPT